MKKITKIENHFIKLQLAKAAESWKLEAIELILDIKLPVGTISTMKVLESNYPSIEQRNRFMHGKDGVINQIVDFINEITDY